MAKTSFFKSSLGQKQLVGLTGLALSAFLFSHVLGNFLVFIGPEAYNKYSHALVSNPLIYLIEAGLVAVFFSHLILASKVTLNNKLARPTPYMVNGNDEKATSQVTKSMWYQGVVILVFSILHLKTFKYGEIYMVSYNGVEMRDIYKNLVEVFTDPIYVIGYFICMIVVGFHLSHGLQSSIRTLGFNHPSYEPKILKLSYFFAFFVAFGFICQPIYIYITN